MCVMGGDMAGLFAVFDQPVPVASQAKRKSDALYRCRMV